jgi:CBS domain-containing protein/anti-sigma regulatory factor (Ser/Thr protein kinase)
VDASTRVDSPAWVLAVTLAKPHMDKSITKIQEIFHELRVEEVMTRDVITVTPQTSMRELEEILRVHRISGTPVLADDSLVGIVSLMDLIRTLGAGQIEQTVSEHMTYTVEALYADERVIAAIRKLQKTGYGRFPVVDRATGKLVGILTQGDIIKGTLKQLDIHYRQREVAYYRAQHFFQDVVSQDTSIILRYTIQARDFVHGGEASSQFKRSLQNLGIHPEILRRVAVATYEAEMNLVLHTTAGGRVRADVRPDTIRIDVSDGGPGIPDVGRAMQPGFSTAPEWIREMGFGAGMGLSNIKSCADEMSLTSTLGKGTHLKILFRLSPQET